MKRKIYEKQIVDTETGEVITSMSVSVSKFNETFLMARNTDALNWLYELTGNEIKTLVFFTDLEDLQKGENLTGETLLSICKFTPIERKRLASVLNCSDRFLRRIIASLEKLGWLIKLSNSDYLINPCGFYKGSSKELGKRIVEYNRLLKASRGGFND